MHTNKDTLVVHAGRGALYPGAPLNVPPIFSSTYVAGTERVYARESHETTIALEAALGALEGGEAVVFASGMAAVSAAIEVLCAPFRPLPRVLVPEQCYGGTLVQLRERAAKGEIDLDLLDARDTQDILEAIAGHDVVWLESPSNPLLGVYDIAEIARRCHLDGARLCVDSTFATPIAQNPISLGADVVVHSASKYIGGHSDLLGGVAVAGDPGLARGLRSYRGTFGAVIGPMEAFLALRGLRTLAIRVERASTNAMNLAEMLEAHPAVSRVYYPFLASSPYNSLARAQMALGGAMVSFELEGTPYYVERFCDSLRLAINSTSLGGVETQAERRARHKGEKISPGLIRVSVGIENSADINSDFAAALERVYGPF